MTLSDLEKLEALHAAATPANYRTDTDHPDTIAIVATMNAFPAMAKALREAWERVTSTQGMPHRAEEET